MALFSGNRRRWLYVGGSVVGLAALALVLLLVVYPRVGASKIRSKLAATVQSALGREVKVGPIDVELGRAVLRDVQIRGPQDGDTPLVHVERVEVAFDAWSSLVGSVRLGPATIDGVTVTIRRDATGRDNVRDVLEHWRQRQARADGGGGGSTRPSSITVERIKVLAEDAVTGANALVADGRATWRPGELVASLKGLTATTRGAPNASAQLVTVKKLAGEAPTVTVEGGELAVWPRLALSGIGGTIAADPAHPGHYTLDLAGGYGGVPGTLWTAKGALDPDAQRAAVDLVAAEFQLERLAPILEQTPVVDYAGTSVDTKLHLEVDPRGGTFDGELVLRGLNVGHPLIADKEVHDLDLQARVAGSFDRARRRVELVRGDFVVRELPFSITGFASQHPPRPSAPAAPPAPDRDDTGDGDEDVASLEARPRTGPGGLGVLDLRLVIPKLECQRVLEAIPTEMAPYLAGYRLRGKFDADVRLAIDWADLPSTILDGHVGLRQCRVVDEPEDGPKRLLEEFEHYVEVEKDQWISFVVGPSNEDFVPLQEISPYLIKSIMSTEDSAFYKHKGFITSEFRTALVKNLEAGHFKYGASSITMQFVKNVLLYREKTLARKLQELFLTWHVENTLPKDRILEIYFNVIEYGPGLYGIGPASWHYFSKPPRDLNPVEAAFFSSILPSPKERYKQYCAGTLTKWTTSKIQRILAIMRKRDRLTEAEYQNALVTPLLFAKDDSETEKQCLERVKKAIQNARPTNPLKK